jgi:hypothetical protein
MPENIFYFDFNKLKDGLVIAKLHLKPVSFAQKKLANILSVIFLGLMNVIKRFYRI